MNAPAVASAPAASAPIVQAPTIIGMPFGGGFFTGHIRIGDHVYAEITAPKAEGELRGRWSKSLDRVEGALSYFDGLANTRAMAEAGSEIAQWALAARIGGFDDWHIPALDQLELRYRHLKPGTQRNFCWLRDGINLNAVPNTQPYTPEAPAQTGVEIFRADGAEAFEQKGYWTSTQSAASSDCAYAQYFDDGTQHDCHEGNEFWVRLVRRIPI